MCYQRDHGEHRRGVKLEEETPGRRLAWGEMLIGAGFDKEGGKKDIVVG